MLPAARESRAEEDVRRLVHQLTLQVLDSEPGLRVLGCEGERISAALTITLTALDAADLDLVQESGLDPDRLVEQMRRAAPEAAAELIDDRAHSLYEVLLLGSCTHLVEHFVDVPRFQDRTLVEIRRQLAVLEHRIAEADRRSAAFEAVHRAAAVAAHADARLYVNLHVSSAGEDGNRPEDLIAAYPRLLVEGPAGAGKTTLLQRLALRVSENELPSQLDEWRERGLMPFLLRLRRFVGPYGLRLPSPEEFVDGEIAEGKPENWVTELLRQRRAIVLLDGVDEIPAAYRPKLIAWLESLLLLYPDARFLLTARPDALDTAQRERLERLGFATGRLEPMTTNQVDDFIRRWHAMTPVPAETAAAQARRLIDTLATRRDLARLATNPLLCAMLCALDGPLARDRDALFEATLIRLLGSAESGRAVLSGVALAMTLRGRRTVERAALPPEAPDAVFRTAGDGLVEFRHPCLQDYLAASAVFQEHALDHVIRNAGDPLYRDVLIMAAGQSHNDADRRDLLSGLTARARAATGEEARVLWLLAAACVAGIESVAPDHAELIREQTRRLLPPRTADEARSLAKAGRFVFDLVADMAARRHLSAEEAAATIEVAILTGGDDAIPLLGRFARHAAKKVRKALVDAWFGSRVPEQYAVEVLAGCSLTDIVVVLPGAEYLPYLHRLSGLRHLDLTRMEIADLEPLASLGGLRHLYLASARNVKNLDLIRSEIPELQIMS